MVKFYIDKKKKKTGQGRKKRFKTDHTITSIAEWKEGKPGGLNLKH